MKDFYLSQSLSDLMLIIDGQRLPSLKFVLSAKSPVFRAMLFGEFKESNDKENEMKEASVQTFKVLLKYCYFEELVLNDRNDYLMAIEVFKLSHRFQMQYLSHIIEYNLIAMFTIHNIIDIYRFGYFYELKKLLFITKKFVAINCELIVENENLLKCNSINIIKDIIGFMKISPIFIKKIKKALDTIISNNSEWTLELFNDVIDFDLYTIENDIHAKDVSDITPKPSNSNALGLRSAVNEDNYDEWSHYFE